MDVSILTDKWYGESQKLASAVFTLARKLSPCIVFVDEIDSLLRSRNSHGKTEIGCRSISLIQFAQTGSANPWVLRVLSAKFVSAKAFEC